MFTERYKQQQQIVMREDQVNIFSNFLSFQFIMKIIITRFNLYIILRRKSLLFESFSSHKPAILDGFGRNFQLYLYKFLTLGLFIAKPYVK